MGEIYDHDFQEWREKLLVSQSNDIKLKDASKA